MGKLLLRILVIVMVIIMAVSCEHDHNDINSIDINLSTVNQDSILYSQFVDSITYIPLLLDENITIGSIDNVKFTDTNIIAFDSRANQVLLFTSEGQFLRKIGSRGRGHGEYIRPLRLDIDTLNRLILIYDIVQESVLKYKFDNTFVGKDSIGHASDMAYLGNGKYFVADFNDETDNAGLYVVESNPYKRKQLYRCRDDVPMMKPWELFRNDDRLSVMSRQYEDRLMEWDGEKLVTTIDFRVSPSPAKKDLEQIHESPINKMKFPNRMTFCDSDRWFYTFYWLDDLVKYIFFDKKEKETIVTNSLINNIDSIYGSELPICVNNTWVSLVKGETDSENPRLQLLHLKN